MSTDSIALTIHISFGEDELQHLSDPSSIVVNAAAFNKHQHCQNLVMSSVNTRVMGVLL
jgi:hypothetical protein